MKLKTILHGLILAAILAVPAHAQFGACLPGFCKPNNADICGRPLPTMVTSILGIWDTSCPSSFVLGPPGAFSIHSVVDATGNGNGMVKAGSSNFPQYVSNFNTSFPAIQFTATDVTALCSTAVFPMGTGDTITIWYVGTFAQLASDTFGRVMSYSTTGGGAADSNSAGRWGIHANASLTTDTLVRNNISETTVAGTAAPDGHRFIFTIDSSGTMTTYVDGVASATSSSPGNWLAGGNLCLGVDAFGGGNFWRGLMGEAGVASSFTDSTNVAALDLFLKNKWGL